jgi:hypothetical protein
MAAELRDLARVRELRAMLARNTSVRLREVVTRAERTLEEACRRKESLENEAVQAVAQPCSTAENSGASLAATDLHNWMNFAAGKRLQAREAAGQIRRAELVRDRAQEEFDEAREEYRRQAARCRTLAAEAHRRQQAASMLEEERAQENLTEERVNYAVAVTRTEL